MFRSHQIITPHKLSKNLSSIIKEMSAKPQAILITPKGGVRLVLVNAEIFEDLIDFRYSPNDSAYSQLDSNK